MNVLERTLFAPDWITVVLFLSLIFLTLSKYLFQSRFLSFIVLPFNTKYIVLYNKKEPLLHGFHILLTLFQLINFSLFLFLCQKNLLGAPLGNTLGAFFILMSGLLLFQLGKLGVQYFKGFVFNTQNLIAELLFYKTSYLNYSSFVMCMGNLVLVYVLSDSIITIYIVIALIIVINVVGILKLLKSRKGVVFPYFLYFILYLCTLDIAPLVLLGSYIND